MDIEKFGMVAATARPQGLLEQLLEKTPASSWLQERETLAAAYNRCSRVRMVLARNADKFGVDVDDLKQDSWVIFQNTILPVLDNPTNVYSALYKVAEYCSRTIVNARKELTLSVERGEDAEDTVSRMLEAANPNGHDMAQAINDELDTIKAGEVVLQKLEMFGWPDDIPRDDSAYRRAGRPLKEANSQQIMQINRTIQIGFPPNARQTRGHIASVEKVKPNTRDALPPMASKLFDIRLEMHLPVDKFAVLVGSKVESLRAMLCGSYVNEILAKQMLKAARLKLAEMKSDPALRHVLKTDMKKLMQEWHKLLRTENEITMLKQVAKISDRKYSTLYRWYKDNRKPININDLLQIDALVRVFVIKLQDRKTKLAEKSVPQKRAKKPKLHAR